MKMIKENNTVMAYTWVDAGNESHWELVGEVMGGIDKDDNGGKTQYQGQVNEFKLFILFISYFVMLTIVD